MQHVRGARRPCLRAWRRLRARRGTVTGPGCSSGRAGGRGRWVGYCLPTHRPASTGRSGPSHWQNIGDLRGFWGHLGPRIRPQGGPRNRVPRPIVKRNPRVSPKSVEKACHSPCFTFGLQKSALEILRFSFSPAFSHKELMGHFEARLVKVSQNDEVSPMCTPLCSGWYRGRRGRRLPPDIPDSGPEPGILPSSRVRSLAQRCSAVTQNIG